MQKKYIGLRNLVQYKNLSDDEFQELMSKRALDLEPIKEFESRIERLLKKFEEDYDLSDMKINDMKALRALAQAIITLDDLETYTYKLRKNINLDNITLLEKIGRQMSDLRNDISKLQNDLSITRKIRKGDKEQSVITFIQSLKDKARQFYESKMSYVFCPKCNMLLATVWFLYPDANNKLTFVCKRDLGDGNKCNTKFSVYSKDLLNNKNSNKPELLPDSMK